MRTRERATRCCHSKKILTPYWSKSDLVAIHMGKKDKKKGQGAAKTAAKTEKKANTKLKKEMAAKGEVSVLSLLIFVT